MGLQISGTEYRIPKPRIPDSGLPYMVQGFTKFAQLGFWRCALVFLKRGTAGLLILHFAKFELPCMEKSFIIVVVLGLNNYNIHTLDCFKIHNTIFIGSSHSPFAHFP